jgi:hypothetical protein
LVPVLRNPDTARDREVLLPGMQPGEFAIINERWRYIHYADGEEELYDVVQDPHEWENLAGQPEFAGAKANLRAVAPTAFAPPGPASSDLRLEIQGETFRWERRVRKQDPAK